MNPRRWSDMKSPTDKAKLRLLNIRSPEKLFVTLTYEPGKCLVGTQSQHLTPSGRKYNKLLNILHRPRK